MKLSTPTTVAPSRAGSFRQPSAFTLMEMLASMVVFTLILSMMGQIVDGILRSTRRQNSQLDSVAEARQALDVMRADFDTLTAGENAAILAADNNQKDLLAMLTSRRGVRGGGAHRFLAVSYGLDEAGHLFRAQGSVDYEAKDLMAATVEAPKRPIDPLASGVLALRFRARIDGVNDPVDLNSNAAVTWKTRTYNDMQVPSGYQALLTPSQLFVAPDIPRVSAIEIWLAAMDEASLKQLQKSGKLTTVSALFGPDPLAWRGAVDRSADLPPGTKSALRIFNKTILLP